MNPTPPYQNDEISLVDLTLIVIKHVKVWAVSFFIFLALTSTYIITAEKNYEIVSILEIGSNSTTLPIESANNVTLKFNSGLVPQEAFALQFLTLDVEAFSSNPKDPLNTTVQLSTNAPKSKLEKYTKIHNSLLTKIIDQHKTKISNNKKLIQSQIDFINQSNVKSESSIENLRILFLSLGSLRNSEVSTLAQISTEPVGTPKSTLLAAAIFLSLIISITLCFFVEFVSIVKSRLNN